MKMKLITKRIKEEQARRQRKEAEFEVLKKENNWSSVEYRDAAMQSYYQMGLRHGLGDALLIVIFSDNSSGELTWDA